MFRSHANFETGLRLADKRSLPCPNRIKWLTARDELYENVMKNAWNAEKSVFGQSYEDSDVLDSAVLIMPLVFFMQPVRIQISSFPGAHGQTFIFTSSPIRGS